MLLRTEKMKLPLLAAMVLAVAKVKVEDVVSVELEIKSAWWEKRSVLVVATPDPAVEEAKKSVSPKRLRVPDAEVLPLASTEKRPRGKVVALGFTKIPVLTMRVEEALSGPETVSGPTTVEEAVAM